MHVMIYDKLQSTKHHWQEWDDSITNDAQLAAVYLHVNSTVCYYKLRSGAWQTSLHWHVLISLKVLTSESKMVEIVHNREYWYAFFTDHTQFQRKCHIHKMWIGLIRGYIYTLLYLFLSHFHRCVVLCDEK